MAATRAHKLAAAAPPRQPPRPPKHRRASQSRPRRSWKALLLVGRPSYEPASRYAPPTNNLSYPGRHRAGWGEGDSSHKMTEWKAVSHTSFGVQPSCIWCDVIFGNYVT
ncbi:hypothetical protein J6590_076448 [Homalodisca vitripennis]|nr:hypothetical protein J6590_076448 [Homalodisca vitripennis]